jgi:HlyD family secretion protein
VQFHPLSEATRRELAHGGLDPDAVAALDAATLTAGMPVEVAIRTGERRAGDYFLEPILRHLGRALRDE